MINIVYALPAFDKLILRIICVLCLIFSHSLIVLGQEQTSINSLLQVLNTNISDKQKVDTYVKIAEKYSYYDSLNTTKYANKAIQLAEKINYSEGKIDAILEVAWVTFDIGYYNQGEMIYQQVKQMSDSIGYQLGKARSVSGLAAVANHSGNLEKSLEYNFQALKTFEKLGYKKGMSKVYNNFGIAYGKQRELAKSLKYFFQALKISKEFGYQYEMAVNYSNIGRVYERKKDYQKALEYHFLSLKIKKEIGDSEGIMFTYSNIGFVYKNQGNDQKALEYGLKTLEIKEKTGLKKNITQSLILIGQIYQKQGKKGEAKKYLQEALVLSKEILEVEDIRDAAKALSVLEKELGNYRQAYEAYVLFKQMADKLQNEAQTRRITRMEAENEFKQEKDSIKFANEAQRVALEKDIETRKVTQISTFIGLGLLAISLVILFLFLQSKRKSNKLLTQKSQQLELSNSELKSTNEELKISQEQVSTQRDHLAKANKQLDTQNKQLDIQNKKIDASLRVAQSIQKAFSTYEKKLANSFDGYFLLNLPKDVVSGDFYWIHQEEKKTILAVADCTGHGVPGAFMTLIGDNLLDRVVKIGQESDPAKILDQLHQEVNIALQQKETGNNQGMDAIVITIERMATDISLSFAGAKNGLLIWSNNELVELKGTRKSIGGIQNEKISFMKHSISLQKGDILYLGSDGLRDQNNVKRRTFGNKRLLRLISEIAPQPLYTQKTKIESALFEYMRGTEQRDDILWMGVRV